VLLDFYIWNCNLSADGYKVKAAIVNETKGDSLVQNLTDWKAYFIHNLGLGNAHVTLTLLDKSGNPVAGPNTSITRNIKLSAQ